MIDAFFSNTWFFIRTSPGFFAPWLWEYTLYYPIAYLKHMKVAYDDYKEHNI